MKEDRMEDTTQTQLKTAATRRRLRVADARDVTMALRHVRAVCTGPRYHPLRRSLAIVATHELARNIVSHAGRGELELGLSADRRSLRITAEDHGPGIEQAEAMLEASRVPGTQGLRGFGILQNVASRFQLQSSPRGTTVEITIELEPAPMPGEVETDAA